MSAAGLRLATIGHLRTGGWTRRHGIAVGQQRQPKLLQVAANHRLAAGPPRLQDGLRTARHMPELARDYRERASGPHARRRAIEHDCAPQHAFDLGQADLRPPRPRSIPSSVPDSLANLMGTALPTLVVGGFRRPKQTLLVTALNGGFIRHSRSTGSRRVNKLTKLIQANRTGVRSRNSRRATPLTDAEYVEAWRTSLPPDSKSLIGLRLTGSLSIRAPKVGIIRKVFLRLIAKPIKQSLQALRCSDVKLLYTDGVKYLFRVLAG